MPSHENEPLPNAESAPLSLETLLDTGRVVIGKDGACELWTVVDDPDKPGAPALQRPWRQIHNDDSVCTGSTVVRFERVNDGLLIHSKSVRNIECTGPTATLGVGSYCGGPYSWKIEKSTNDSVLLILPWNGDPADEEERSPRQGWYLTQEACERDQRVARFGGC